MKNIVRKYCPSRTSRLLEIGAYDRPTFTKEEACIRFVDAQSKEDLVADALLHGRCIERIVDVDYVIQSNEYEKYIPDTFDAIIADNVFEHISNPIRWLQTLDALLREDGYVFLRIPEYDKGFGRFRSPTTFAHILTDYIRNVPDLDPEHSVEVGIYYDMGYIKQSNEIQEKINLQRSLHDYQNPHYGVHCHTFLQKTFVNKIMKPILLLGVVDFTIRECSQSGPHSFTLVLQKGKEDVSLTFDEFTESCRDDVLS